MVWLFVILRATTSTFRIFKSKSIDLLLLKNLLFVSALAVMIASNFFLNGPIADIYRSFVYTYDQKHQGTIQRCSVSGSGLKGCKSLRLSYYYMVDDVEYMSTKILNESDCIDRPALADIRSLKAGDRVSVYVEAGRPEIPVLKVVRPGAWQWFFGLLLLSSVPLIFPPKWTR